MIHDTRVRVLNDGPVREGREGRYVLYWMQQSQRARFNHALEYAARQANELGLPLLVGFGLMDDYPEANERHYAFMLEGLRDVSADLRGPRRQVRPAPRQPARRGDRTGAARPPWWSATAATCATRSGGATRWPTAAGRRVVEVESDVVVPVEVASDKQESAARTLRPKIRRHLRTYLVPLRPDPAEARCVPAAGGGRPGRDLDPADVEGTLAKLKIDRSVPRSRHFRGGSAAAAKRLADVRPRGT